MICLVDLGIALENLLALDYAIDIPIDARLSAVRDDEDHRACFLEHSNGRRDVRALRPRRNCGNRDADHRAVMHGVRGEKAHPARGTVARFVLVYFGLSEPASRGESLTLGVRRRSQR